MKPALFLYPHIGSYSFMMLLAFAAGWAWARNRARYFSIEPRHLDNISLLLPILCLVGARLFARLFYAKLPLLEALKVWEGDGLVFYGGFIFGVATVLAYSWIRRINLMAFAECLAPSVALGLALGRVGCFLAGCCWGDVCVDAPSLAQIEDKAVVRRIQTFPSLSPAGMPLAVQFPKASSIFKQHEKYGLVNGLNSASLPVHPVQLYEAALALALAVFLDRMCRGARRPGDVAAGFLFGYAAIRFLTEYFRADNKIYALGCTFSQVVSIWIACAAVLLLIWRKYLPRTEKPEDSPRSEPNLQAAGVGSSNSI